MWFILMRLLGIMPERSYIENVFDKPDEQRPSLLGLCHGEKTKAKPTFSLSTSGVGKAKHLSSIPTDHGEVTDKVNDKVETTY